MKIFLVLLLSLLLSLFSKAQSLAINTDGSAAGNSAILDVKSTTKGLLIPRLTKAQKYAIATPATGLLVYQTGPDSIGFYYYQNSQWTWLTDSKRADSTYWGLHGNNNTTPPASANNAPINYATDTYLGTFQAEDVSIIAGGNEMLRLKQVPQGGRIGFSNRNPEYGLDMRLSDPNPTSDIVGMRIISTQLFDFNNPNLNKGLVIGNNRFNPNETAIWNHANNQNGVIRIGIDAFNNSIRPAISINQYGEGIYQRNPRYALDIHSRSQFAPATVSTSKNGIRITYLDQESQNDDQKGLVMGVDVNNSFKSYLWNYADGQGGNSPDRAIYFGVGGDMDLSNQRATMELQDGKITIGRITDPNFFFPSTLNIQTDYAASVAKNGISVMKHITSQESGYFGTDANDNLNLYKYGGGKILLGSSPHVPITINSSNFVGIKTLYPNADLQFNDEWANNKIVLHNNFHGDIPNNFHDFYGFGVNDNGILRYQVPRNFTDHVFYGGNNAGTASNELLRITGNGFVGIGFNNPKAPLEFNSSQENRKIVLARFGVNNDHNFFGFGRTNGELRYQVSISTDDHVFYKGDASGTSSTELLRVLGSGNVGIGTNLPSEYGHGPNGRILEIKNPLVGPDIQSHLMLSSASTGGSLGGVTWAGVNLSGEKRTGFIGNTYETTNQTKLSFYTRSNTGVLAERFYIQGTGNAWLQGTLTQASDARLKKNIQPLASTLNKLDKINGYTYNWINDQKDNEEQIGLLAQEVQKNYPQLVKQNDKGELSVNYSGLVPVLLEGIKEQQKQIETLKYQNIQQQLQIESILKKIK